VRYLLPDQGRRRPTAQRPLAGRGFELNRSDPGQGGGSDTGRRVPPALIGIACGIGAAMCWGAGFVAARHGVSVGLRPADIAFHRYAWTGLFLLPTALAHGVTRLGGVGWGRSILLALLAGPTQAIASAAGFMMTPLGHGAVIQPSSAAVSSLLLAAVFLHEHLSPLRLFGVATIVGGLCLLGAEAMGTIGRSGVAGDTLFLCAGVAWGIFGTLLRRWSIDGQRAAAVIGAVSVLIYAPAYAVIFGFHQMIAFGLWENLVQIVAQGVLAGAFAIYLFGRAVVLLGAGRGGVFTTLVPGFTLIIGYLTIGEAPTLLQLVGLAIVMLGFRFVMMR
jgi:drug/metabolite transporter (DMT)-like permease